MEKVKIDLVPSGVMSTAHASQFDIGRTIRFMLTDEGVSYTLAGTEVITMTLRKPDGTDDTFSLTNTSSNYVEWTTSDGDLNLSGVYLAEITITSGSDVIGSMNFLLKVEPDAFDGKNIRTITVGPADICTFEANLPEPYKSVLVDVEATGGNGTPDSPIPINGYTEANITRCGVNLWDEQWEVGGISVSTGQNDSSTTCIRTKNYIPIVPNTEYFACFVGEGTLPTLRTRFYDINKNYIGPYEKDGSAVNYNTRFVSPENAYYLRFSPQDAYGTTYNNDISINYPSTDTTYHPYNGTTYTIAFGQTVYGGSLDVTRGKLTATHERVNLGSLTYTQANTNTAGKYRFGASVSPLPKKTNATTDTPDIICEGFATETPSRTYACNNGITIGNTDSALVYIYYEDYCTYTPDQFKNAVNNIYLVYELATPIEIDLTPVQISALVGENNVFADCGQTTLEYLDEE